MTIEEGTLVAQRFRVLGLLGKGGMGEVFAAENTRTGRRVALKVLRPESKDKQTAVERFRREARAAGAIRSEFVTEVYDVEEDAEHGIVLVFELLEGESLVDRLKRTGPMPLVELWGVVEAVWVGLADAHAAGIIHRDLKPSNVFLLTKTSPARVKLLDFGISKLPKAITTDSLTQVGQSLGTFSFMPPEQIGRAKTVDHRADIYACTTLIYQALTGKLPYLAKNAVVMMELKLRQDPLTLADAVGAPVDPRLEAFVARGLARDPDTRFQTANEALVQWQTLRPSDAVSFVASASQNRGSAAMTEPTPSEENSQTDAGTRRRSLPDSTQAMPVLVEPRPLQRPDEDVSTLQRPSTAMSITPQSAPFAAPAPAPRAPETSRPALPSTSAPERRQSLVTMAAAAVALMLLGFGIVALALRFLR
ncbi:MAG: serine/threonine protein kinase [Deltaproteobacteria bacterium]|nr:serine/threonine protein kinase [Deltaproteobacteria bacterium]